MSTPCEDQQYILENLWKHERKYMYFYIINTVMIISANYEYIQEKSQRGNAWLLEDTTPQNLKLPTQAILPSFHSCKCFVYGGSAQAPHLHNLWEKPSKQSITRLRAPTGRILAFGYLLRVATGSSCWPRWDSNLVTPCNSNNQATEPYHLFPFFNHFNLIKISNRQW